MKSVWFVFHHGAFKSLKFFCNFSSMKEIVFFDLKLFYTSELTWIRLIKSFCTLIVKQSQYTWKLTRWNSQKDFKGRGIKALFQWFQHDSCSLWKIFLVGLKTDNYKLTSSSFFNFYIHFFKISLFLTFSKYKYTLIHFQ